MRHTFESLGYQSGFYLSQLFSSNRNTSSSSTSIPSNRNTSSSSTSIPSKQSAIPIHPPPLFNWAQRLLPSPNSMLSSPPNFQNSAARVGFPQAIDETYMLLLPYATASETIPRIEDMMGGDQRHEGGNIKWPNGLSFSNALTGRTEDAKLLFNPDNLGNKPENQNHHPLFPSPNSDAHRSVHNAGGRGNPNEFFSLDSHTEEVSRKMENKFKMSFTLPARMASSSSSAPVDHPRHQQVEYRNSEARMYTAVMDTFLE